ncbi:MAG: hypothetical protein HQL11_03165 [Candidatus Omnitrophica bacterium]|nr:hypothetical protein [Candidatus Omnitrophota bacterium]
MKNERIERLEKLNKRLEGLEAGLEAKIGSAESLAQDLDKKSAERHRRLEGLVRKAESRPKSPEGPAVPHAESPFAAAAATPGAAVPSGGPDERMKEYFEKILSGSLESMGEKLSSRLVDMLKDIQVSSGHVREAKMHQLRQVAEEENIDLSALFKHVEVESNLGHGTEIEEEETKGISDTLEKLRKLREGG